MVKPVPPSEIKRRLAAAARTQRAFVALRLEKEAAERRLVYGPEATALLAHDLNNGLAVALSNLQYLMEDFAPTTTDQGDALASDAAVGAPDVRASSRTSSISRGSRTPRSSRSPRTATCATCSQSVIETNGAALSRGIEAVIDCEPTLQGRFDHALVERVLHNLFGNASRYCNQGGKIVLAGRRLHATDSDSVLLAITNTGPLIPPDLAANLFGKYARGSGGKRGMGLYFCRLVAEAHGGRMDYEPTPVGPCFSVRLPGHA